MPERDILILLERAKHLEMTVQEKEEQRRSFAYGNANIENSFVTREVIDDAAEQLARKPQEHSS